jgi:hypothetical protein
MLSGLEFCTGVRRVQASSHPLFQTRTIPLFVCGVDVTIIAVRVGVVHKQAAELILVPICVCKVRARGRTLVQRGSRTAHEMGDVRQIEDQVSHSVASKDGTYTNTGKGLTAVFVKQDSNIAQSSS